MPHGAARNALDSALWDLVCKRACARAWNLAELAPPAPLRTVLTIGLAAPAAMGEATAAAVASGRTLLMVKLGAGDGDDDARIAAVRGGAGRNARGGR